MKHLSAIIAILALTLTSCSAAIPAALKTKESGEAVVLLHGLGRSGMAMWRLEQTFEDAGYEVVTIDYDSLGHSEKEVIQQASRQISDCCKKAERVHFVGHSLGGLIIRAYFETTESAVMKAKLGQVVMIGTPNKGSAIVDHYQNRWWFNSLGGITKALNASPNGLANKLPTPPFRAGVIAGNKSWYLSDDILKEENDGLVSVRSTQLENMADFIEVDSSHSMLRYNTVVAKQTAHFLKHGRFEH